MSETWNAEKQAYADCEGCHGKGWFDNGAVIVEPCNVCLPRRIAELEAREESWRADFYTVKDMLSRTTDTLGVIVKQRDDLANALIAIRDEFDGKCWEWCDTRQLTVPAEFQVHGMPHFVAREALRRLEGESKQAHGSDHVEDSSR